MEKQNRMSLIVFSGKDIPAWVTKARHEMLGTRKEQDYTRFVVRKTH